MVEKEEETKEDIEQFIFGEKLTNRVTLLDTPSNSENDIESNQENRLSDISFSSEEIQYRYIKKVNNGVLYQNVKSLLLNKNWESNFVTIVPLLMLEVNLYNIQLEGILKRAIVCEFLTAILEDKNNELYKLLNCEEKTRKLLAYVCPNIIDILYNISVNGFDNKFKKYEDNYSLDEDDLVNMIIENTKDLDFDDKNMNKDEYITLFSALLMGVISFIEVQKIKGLDKKKIVMKVIKKIVKGHIHNNEDLILNLSDLIELFVKIANQDLSIQGNYRRILCSCFSYFF